MSSVQGTTSVWNTLVSFVGLPTGSTVHVFVFVVLNVGEDEGDLSFVSITIFFTRMNSLLFLFTEYVSSPENWVYVPF